MKALLACAIFLGACEDGSDRAQAVCALVDTSGTYADQVGNTSQILRQAVLPQMRPGDTLVVAKIVSDSYDKHNVEAAVTLDSRPSQATMQKAALGETLEKFAGTTTRANHTDITGGIMLCGEYLSELKAKKKIIIVFSDMKEELPAGYERTLEARELEGIAVVAMNVKRLKADGQKPAEYRARLSKWENLLHDKGSREWQVIIEPERLLDYLDRSRG